MLHILCQKATDNNAMMIIELWVTGIMLILFMTLLWMMTRQIGMGMRVM
jgi:hypothetical protein